MADLQVPFRSPTGAQDSWAAAGALLPTFMVTFATLVIACEVPGIAPFWPADAVVLTLLLQTPARAWWKGLLTGGFGLVAARVVVGSPFPLALTLSGLNLMEILICASALAVLTRERLDLKRPAHLAAFFVSAGALAPLSSAFCAAWLLSQSRHEPFLPDMATWYRANALGLVVATPLLLTISRFLSRRYGAATRAARPCV